ncbi:hypothetical protein PGTUg99_022261 [Puccinia graminis f. sp. tritici]|uniref:Uncharacterized protein n=1 Tax=Puccinia graminis f. sp. tritici TaxID=56615 RepID=A0A5B0R7S3_PUCGR|nr:hypothetical protein PGTUg99_022261 [Puccinia graminis f. sp. tritici]
MSGTLVEHDWSSSPPPCDKRTWTRETPLLLPSIKGLQSPNQAIDRLESWDSLGASTKSLSATPRTLPPPNHKSTDSTSDSRAFDCNQALSLKSLLALDS